MTRRGLVALVSAIAVRGGDTQAVDESVCSYCAAGSSLGGPFPPALCNPPYASCSDTLQSAQEPSFHAIFQDDSNLVVYDAANKAKWASATVDEPGAILQMQADGNLVMYASDGDPVWASQSTGYGLPPYCLTLETNGDLTIFDSQCLVAWRNGRRPFRAIVETNSTLA
ncbi:Aste57867_19701 [Aphanomyces stellatus]|uniref:Aste57867_19701 protein n=1 Tax=Aphanomyces stellatus TaxID=120398 RepID=A0A485LD16_9STRA|nr:hypothetical protein As57867_019636 [Aphanomyces stellatus]VFT96401.1 Aste57867_19701 [Aphanomyces stellatus]